MNNKMRETLPLYNILDDTISKTIELDVQVQSIFHKFEDIIFVVDER